MNCSHLLSSQGSIKKGRGKIQSAVANIVTVLFQLALSDAIHSIGENVDEGASNSRNEDHVLLPVIEINQFLEVGHEMADIAESVDLVGGLGERDVGDVELSDLSRVVNVNVLEDGETRLNWLNETTAAVSVVLRDEAVNGTDEEALPVGSSVKDLLLDGLWVEFIKKGANWVSDIFFWLLSESLSSSTVGLEKRLSLGTVQGVLLIESVDVDTFLYLQKQTS